MRHWNKPDQNQATIVRELRDRGALVYEIGRPVDLLVGYRGQFCTVEIKRAAGVPMRPSQSKWFDHCARHKPPLPCFLIDDLDDVDTFFPLLPDPENGDTDSAPDNAGTDQPLGGAA